MGLCRVADVGRDGERRPATIVDLGCDRVELVAAAGNQGNARAGVCEPERDLPADSSACPGDERDPAFKRSFHHASNAASAARMSATSVRLV